MLIVDVDRIKATNTAFGRDAADALLRAIGQRIASVIDPETTFRTGGNEFTVIVQDLQRLQNLHDVADRIMKAAKAPFHYDGVILLPAMTLARPFWRLRMSAPKSFVATQSLLCTMPSEPTEEGSCSTLRPLARESSNAAI
jgi:GGDEF domain-containing protein